MWGVLFAAAVCLGGTQTISAQTAANVLLVINESSPDSVQVGEHYARVRGIDQAQVLRVRIDPRDEVDRQQFERNLESPIGAWLTRNLAHDRILYIVLTKGVPLRVTGSAGRQGTTASVDSELTLLYRKLVGTPVPAQGPMANPYYLGPAPPAEARPFTHERHDIYLVTRLDGFSVADVMALIDRAQTPASTGRIVLDMKASWNEQGNTWLATAAERLATMGKGDQVLLERTSDVVTGTQGVLGYYSWGSNDRAIKTRKLGFGFLPGAIAATFVSSDGRTFTEPPASWTLGSWSDRSTFYAGSPQSLTGDLIREGVTGAAGHVAEPFLDATIRPEILFPTYLAGYPLAEAFYLAMPYISWQTVVIGDPLCAVAPRTGAQTTALAPPVDPKTELPAFFSARRFENLKAQPRSRSFDASVIEMTMQAESRLARDQVNAAVDVLVKATAAEPGLAGAQLLLATQFERRGDYPAAVERYRNVLAVDQNNAIALNNLAYIVGVRQGRPAEGLPLAERAFTLSQGNPTIADTVGWLHHLLGNSQEAMRYLRDALRGAPQSAEVHLHAALAFAGAGQLDAARKLLDRAGELDKTVLESEEARELATRLSRRPAK